MSDQELLYKILAEVSEVRTGVAVIEERQENHIKKQDTMILEHADLKTKHFKLHNDFKAHKNRFLVITGAVGSFFGFVANYIYKLFIEK